MCGTLWSKRISYSCHIKTHVVFQISITSMFVTIVAVGEDNIYITMIIFQNIDREQVALLCSLTLAKLNCYQKCFHKRNRPKVTVKKISFCWIYFVSLVVRFPCLSCLLSMEVKSTIKNSANSSPCTHLLLVN